MGFVVRIRRTRNHIIKEDKKRIGFPLDSHVEFDAEGYPVLDRGISSAPLRSLIKGLMTDGVLPDASRILTDVTDGSLRVTPGEGMNVIVNKGFAICNGCLKLQETDRTLALQASTNQDRIDTVVLRLNDNDNVRTCDFYVINGLPSNSPIRPELTRNESVWEIGLADLFISANSTTISSTRITDTRLEEERCGVISAIAEFDTTGLYEQIQSDLAEFKTVEQQQFLEWFQTIIGILDEEVAGHLQLEIGTLSTLTTQDKTDLVSAVNEVNENVGDVTELPATGSVVDNLNVLNTNLVANNTPFVFDYQNGKYGYNTDVERGADTFFPFSGELTFEHILVNIPANNAFRTYTFTKDYKYIVAIQNDHRGCYIEDVDATKILYDSGLVTGGGYDCFKRILFASDIKANEMIKYKNVASGQFNLFGFYE